jgi:hypothetical protein
MFTVEALDNLLAHHGVKGMKWGVRRSRGSTAVVVTDKRKRVKTSGGRGLPAHPDAVPARVIGQKARKSGLKALSDDELQAYAKRMNLEQNVQRLQYQNAPAARKFALSLVGKTGQQQAESVANQVATKQVTKLMKKMAKP